MSLLLVRIIIYLHTNAAEKKYAITNSENEKMSRMENEDLILDKIHVFSFLIFNDLLFIF